MATASEPGLGPLTTAESRSALVVDAIRRAILEGVFVPGDRLVERELAQRLGVSKTPVREALKVLERRGLVASHPYRGTSVRQVDQKLVRDIFEVRLLVEPEAVRRSLALADADHVRALRAACERAEGVEGAQDLVELGLANREFHELLYARCDNTVLCAWLDEIGDQVALIITVGWRMRPSWGRETSEHKEILDAVERGAPDRAVTRLEAHIQTSFEQLVRSFAVTS